jgi:protein tyrosine phosphatase (PTP) superfamily phosphohydrolase (DUF442 family)
MEIMNFYQYNEMLASGAQPTPEQIEKLKINGFEVVFNISPSSAKNALKEEALIVETNRMDYIHFPVDCSNLRPLHYSTFKGIMNGIQAKKVFVHCGGNIKSANLIHMYHVLEMGIDESESYKTLLKIQNPETKWFQYFKSFGMKGLNNN